MNGAARVRLGANECPLPPPPRVLEAIASAASGAARYPDHEGRVLRDALARKHGVTPDHVALGNGASELIDLALAAFVAPGEDIVLCEPTFPLYRMRAAVRGAGVVSVPAREHVHDLRAMVTAVTPRTRIVVVVQPNNPTGTIVSRTAWREFLDALSGRGVMPAGSGGRAASPLVLCDEAYADYVDAPDAPDVLADVRAGRPVISLRTFSKAHSLAGLRVGYAIAPPAIAARLEAVRPRFSVSSTAQAAALAALSSPEHAAEAVALARSGKTELAPALARLGLEVVPSSQASFLCVRLPAGAGDACAELARLGVEVCDLATLGFGMPGWARISTGTPADHALLVRALGTVTASSSSAGA